MMIKKISQSLRSFEMTVLVCHFETEEETDFFFQNLLTHFVTQDR